MKAIVNGKIILKDRANTGRVANSLEKKGYIIIDICKKADLSRQILFYYFSYLGKQKLFLLQTL